MFEEATQTGIGRGERQGAREGLDLFDVLMIFARHKRVLLGFTLAGALAFFLWTLGQPRLYEADAVIMPPQEQQSTSAIMGTLSLLTGLGGGGKTQADLYLGLIQSRTVRERIVTEFGLDHVYGLDRPATPGKPVTADEAKDEAKDDAKDEAKDEAKDDAKDKAKDNAKDNAKEAANRRIEIAGKLLASRTKVATDKAGLITVKVRDKNAQRAALLADAYADALHDLNDHLAITQAAQRRAFYERQLNQEKDRLSGAEDDLRKEEEKTGLLQLSGQTSIVVSQIAQLRANITSREVQLAALGSSATEENPEVVRIRSEVAGLEQQLRAMQGKTGVRDADDLGLPSSKMPGASLEYLRKEREVQYHQTLFELLARQLEAARIDQDKAAPIVQLLDKAEVPTQIAYPKKAQMTALGATVGLLLGMIACVFLYLYDYVDEDPLLHGKLRAVKAELLGRPW